MIIPLVLRETISKALLEVEQNEYHDLPLGHRHAGYAKLGPYLGTSSDKTGHKRRTLLALLTAQHVLPIWERERAEDDTPRIILDKVYRILANQLDAAQVQDDVGRYWTYMDNVAFETEGRAPVGAGLAALSALQVAISDEEFDPESINLNLTDEDVDAYDHDAVFPAAADYAGGPTWVPESDAAKRREFWHWWLKEALPTAWWGVWQPEHYTLQHLLAPTEISHVPQQHYYQATHQPQATSPALGSHQKHLE